MDSVEEQVILLKNKLEKQPDSASVLRYLRKLERLSVTLEHLQNVGIGKVVNTLSKQDNEVGHKAKELVSRWKQMVTLKSDGINKQHVKKEKSSQQQKHEISNDKEHKQKRKVNNDRDHKQKQKVSNDRDLEQKQKVSNDRDLERKKMSNKLSHKNFNDAGHKMSSSHSSNESESKKRSHDNKPSTSVDKRSDLKKNQDKHNKDQRKTHDAKYNENDTMKIYNEANKSCPDKNEKCGSKPTRALEGVNQKSKPKKSSEDPCNTKKSSEDPCNTKKSSEDPCNTTELLPDSGTAEDSGKCFEDFLNYDIGLVKSVVKKKIQSAPNISEAKKINVEGDGNIFEKFSPPDKTNTVKSSTKTDRLSKHNQRTIKSHDLMNNSKDKSSTKHHTSKHSKDKSNKSHNSEKTRENSKPSRNEKLEKKCLKRPAAEFVIPPPPTKQGRLSPTDILQTLPEIQPNYKPLRMPVLDDDSPNKKQVEAGEMEALIGTKKYSRTQIYSGRRTLGYLTEVPRLFDACMKVLQENIDSLECVGGVPTDILMPVLEKCNPVQLYTLENYNVHFVGETEELWKAHCQRDFKLCRPAEFETFREVYLREHDSREARLKNLTASISASMAKKEPVRQTKLAFVNSIAKPPREVLRRQIRHGTAGPVNSPLKPGGSHVRPTNQSFPMTQRPIKQVKVIAPMMQKTLSFMKKMKR